MSQDEVVVRVLRERDGVSTEVALQNGRRLLVSNIAWGYDDGESAAHITTNVSPALDGHSVDVFTTSEVAVIVDPSDGRTLYSA